MGVPRRWPRTRTPRQQLARWGRSLLSPAKIEELLTGARSSVGVRPGPWQQRQIQEYAERALAARQQANRATAVASTWPRGIAVLQAQGKVVGVPTACVLWTSTGDPRKYDAAGAYRKAMGLNLVERSSGTYQGRLRISKRAVRGRGNGSISRSCGWCRSAACVLGTRPRRPAMKVRPGGSVAVMRKLAVALYHVGVDNEEFQPRRLFGRIGQRVGNPTELPSRMKISAKRRTYKPEVFGSDAEGDCQGQTAGHDCRAGTTANVDCPGESGR